MITPLPALAPPMPRGSRTASRPPEPPNTELPFRCSLPTRLLKTPTAQRALNPCSHARRGAPAFREQAECLLGSARAHADAPWAPEGRGRGRARRTALPMGRAWLGVSGGRAALSRSPQPPRDVCPPGPLAGILTAPWAGMERLKPAKQAALPSSGGYKARLLFSYVSIHAEPYIQTCRRTDVLAGAGRWGFNVPEGGVQT